MNPVTNLMERIRGLDIERLAGLRPKYPPLALEMDRNDIVLVRLKRQRRKLPALEAHRVRALDELPAAGSILRPNLAAPGRLTGTVRELLEATGTKPGRVSLVLPDNLAKVSLLTLPDKPASKKQLEEIIRFKVRRSVPFRLEEAVMSYEVLPFEGKGLNVLVVLLKRGVVEQYEKVLQDAGMRLGLIDLCTPNVFNLCRAQIATACHAGGDVALLNCTHAYFSLLIVRRENLIFYRCKTYAVAEEGAAHGAGEPAAAGNGAMTRELAGSFSYYQEKLAGDGVRTAFVRTVSRPFDELVPVLESLGVERVERVDPSTSLELVEGLKLDPELGHRLAPALGAAAGRAG